jgi:hypothetical protein
MDAQCGRIRLFALEPTARSKRVVKLMSVRDKHSAAVCRAMDQFRTTGNETQNGFHQVEACLVYDARSSLHIRPTMTGR